MAGLGRVIGIAKGANAKIPEYTYTGDHLVRFQDYNGTLFAEWELQSSGTMDFADLQSVDLMLVGGGGKSSAPTSGSGGAGGSAFYVVIKNVENVLSMQVVIGAGGGDTIVDANGTTHVGLKGGAASGATGGIGYNGEYRMFNEPGERYVLGTGQNGGNSGGAPGNGFLLSKIKGGVGFDNSKYTTLGLIRQGGTGYGAGQHAREYVSSGSYITTEPSGNPGVVLVRIALL